jgi:hypothetical protein
MLEMINVQLWGKDIKEREGTQNNKQEMQIQGGEDKCYVNKKTKKLGRM